MKTVRVEFSKTDRAKFISHLDLVRTMTRALRRADIPLWYTEGFNRHPYITFAAPLSLGYEGMRETMDLRLEEEMPLLELRSRLNAQMPQGLEILDAYEAQMKPGLLASARYRLCFSCPACVLERFLLQENITVEKRTKKGGMKSVDIRPFLSNVEVIETGEMCEMYVTLPCGSANTVNPQLIRTALTAFMNNEQPVTMQVVRLLLLGPSNQPFR